MQVMMILAQQEVVEEWPNRFAMINIQQPTKVGRKNKHYRSKILSFSPL